MNFKHLLVTVLILGISSQAAKKTASLQGCRLTAQGGEELFTSKN